MHNSLNTPAKVTRVCKSRSTLLILTCCILPFILIFIGFNTPISSHNIFWQNYQSYMVMSGLIGLLLSYWMLLFRPQLVISLVLKEKTHR
jgi:hypothetical protein